MLVVAGCKYLGYIKIRFNRNRFIYATASKTTGITRLRSYNLPEKPSIASTICQAVLAILAATSFFEPMHIGARKFVNGALKANNPAIKVEGEASNIWYSDIGELKPLVKCFISIGTSHPGKKPIKNNIAKFLAGILVAIATETESTADEFIGR